MQNAVKLAAFHRITWYSRTSEASRFSSSATELIWATSSAKCFPGHARNALRTAKSTNADRSFERDRSQTRGLREAAPLRSYMKVNEVFCLTQSLGSDVGAIRPT